MLYTGRINRSFSYINKILCVISVRRSCIHASILYFVPHFFFFFFFFRWNSQHEIFLCIINRKSSHSFCRWLSGHEFSNCDTLPTSVFNTEFENHFKKRKKCGGGGGGNVKDLTAQSTHLRLWCICAVAWYLCFRFSINNVALGRILICLDDAILNGTEGQLPGTCSRQTFLLMTKKIWRETTWHIKHFIYGGK